MSDKNRKTHYFYSKYKLNYFFTSGASQSSLKYTICYCYMLETQ